MAPGGNVDMRVQERRLLVVGPGEGKSVSLGGLGVDFKVWGHETGGRFAIVEHPIDARRLIPRTRTRWRTSCRTFSRAVSACEWGTKWPRREPALTSTSLVVYPTPSGTRPI